MNKITTPPPHTHTRPVFAIDIKNEPHGEATWGAGKPATDWDKAAAKIGKHLLTKHPEFKVWGGGSID